MDRITFLLPQTGARISCLLNPERLVQRRTAGVRRPYAGSGYVNTSAASDDILLHSGGGRTEVDVELLFDIELAAGRTTGDSAALTDVRDLTRPLWDLAENRVEGGDEARAVRMFWGDHWNLLCVVVAVAERLERFDASGAPGRSWLRLRLVRIPDPTPRPVEPPLADAMSPQALTEAASSAPVQQLHVALDPGPDSAEERLGGERLDELATRYYGKPWLWRLIASANTLYDSVFAPPGVELVIPEAPAEAR